MTALALPFAQPRSLFAELVGRQRTLTRYGLALLAIAVATTFAQLIDQRTLDGVDVWVKPTKFLVSVGVFALTAAWLFGYVRPDRRTSPLMRGTVAMLIVAGTMELLYIGWQASQGETSHFNTGALVPAIMYALMGLFAVLLVGTTLPLAWEIGRRPAPGLSRDFVAALVTGLLLTFILGGALGGYMAAQPGHSVGDEGGRVALFGWNRSGGDLRIAHFIGIHAQQAIPVLGALIAGLAARTRWALLIGGSLAYTAVTLAIFAQAVAGRLLLPL